MTSMPLRTLLVLLAGLALPTQAQMTNGTPNAALTAPGNTLAAPTPAAAGAIATPTPAVAGNGLVGPATPKSSLPAAPNGQAVPAPVSAPVAVPEPVAPAVVTPPAPTLSDLGRSLRNYFTEEELELLFQYMKESVIASFNDEEVALPPDLSFKLEILLVRLKKESNHYMDNLIKQMEKDLKKSIKEKLTPPPPKDQPYNPWLSKPWE